MNFLPSPKDILWLVVIGLALGFLLIFFSGNKIKKSVPSTITAVSQLTS